MVFMAFSETPNIFAADMHRCLAALSFAKIDLEEDGAWWWLSFGDAVWLSVGFGDISWATLEEDERLTKFRSFRFIDFSSAPAVKLT